MFDNGTLMPSYTDDVIRYLLNDGPPDYADGEVDAPTGWFAILTPTREEIAHAVSITGSPRAGEAGVFRLGASYGVRQNSDGIVWAYEYVDVDPQSDESVYHDFDRAVDEYASWSMDPEDINAAAGWTDTPVVDYDENGNVIPEDGDERRSSIQPRNFPH